MRKIIFPRIINQFAEPIPFDGSSGEGGGEGGGAGTTPPSGTPAQSTTLGSGEGGGEGQGDGDQGAGAGQGDQGNSQGQGSENGGESNQGNQTDQDGEPLTLKAPEGFEDFQEEFDAFASHMDPWLKANPNATPREILLEAGRRQAELVSQQSTQASEAFNAQLQSWENEAKADAEIGGENYDANVAVARKAIETFGNDAFKQVLNESGMGNHPEVIRFAMKAGAALKEAPVLRGDGAAPAKSFAEKVYPNQN